MQEKMHKCVKCFKSFPSSQQLNQHMLVHNNIRKYRCQYCDKAFKQLSHVQQHQRRHTGERPYKCTIEGCDKAFAQLSNLQQHQRNHDARRQQSDRKPYQCSICDRRFATEVSLNNHISKVHNPDSPAFLSPAQASLHASSSAPSTAVAMVTAAAAAATTSSLPASLPTSSFPGLSPDGIPAMHGPLRLLPPPGVNFEKALMREAISAALAATHHAHAQNHDGQQQHHQQLPVGLPMARLHPQQLEVTPKQELELQVDVEDEDEDEDEILRRRPMEELSKHDLNLLRYDRARLYDFPTQVPHLHSTVYRPMAASLPVPPLPTVPPLPPPPPLQGHLQPLE